MMVFPAPGSSAKRNRSGWRGSNSPYTAWIWWGSGMSWDSDTASIGSKRYAKRIRRASDARRKRCPSASNDHARPAVTSDNAGSSSRYTSRSSTRPASSR